APFARFKVQSEQTMNSGPTRTKLLRIGVEVWYNEATERAGRGSGAPCGAVEIGPVKEKSEAVAQGDRRSRKRDNCQRQVLTPRTQISNPVLGLSALRFANWTCSTRRGGAKQKVIHRLD